MRFPVDQPYQITQGFKPSHLGIDIAPTPAGTKGRAVYAPENSTVAGTGSNPALEGQWIILKGTTGMYYYFGHFAAKFVVYGQKVAEGIAIGTMGMTGLATGIHCHHEVRGSLVGKQIDPAKYYSTIGEDMTTFTKEQLTVFHMAAADGKKPGANFNYFGLLGKEATPEALDSLAQQLLAINAQYGRDGFKPVTEQLYRKG